LQLEINILENPIFNSNCYLLTDKDLGEAIIIDPASERSEREKEFLEKNGLKLAYIILTHGHVDHAWGANSLKEANPGAKLVYSKDFAGDLYTSKFFLRLVCNDNNYDFAVKPADIIAENNKKLFWGEHKIVFILTPGHSPGSMCIDIDCIVFTGDTIMQFRQFTKAKDFNMDEYKSSVALIKSIYPTNTLIYPGHGESTFLENCLNIM